MRCWAALPWLRRPPIRSWCGGRRSSWRSTGRLGFAEALELIASCQAAADALGWNQGYYEMMRARVDGLIDDSPPDWTGVYVAKEK